MMPCNRENCLCEHKDCSVGWVEFRYKKIDEYKGRDGTVSIKETWYDAVRPCPTCDPERAHIFETSKSEKELQERLKERSAFLKTANQTDYEASRTRTL